jgi:hypothetical protein
VHVRFAVPSPSRLQVEVIDLLGRRILSHDLGPRPVGHGEAVLDVSRIAPGRYVIRLLGERALRHAAPLVIAR